MTRKKKKPPLNEQEQEQVQFQYALDNHLNALWEAYVLTNDETKLSDYVRAGGDIDRQNIRDTIATLMITGQQKKPHGSKDVENIAFYIAVESERGSLKPTQKSRKNLSDREFFAALKHPSKDDAIEKIIQRMKIPGRKAERLSIEGGITKHKKGKELFVREFGKGWN